MTRWNPGHLDDQKTVEFISDQFRREVRQELKMLEVMLTDTSND